MLNSNSTDNEIREYYDSNWNCTIPELMQMTGKSKAEIKSILTVIVG